MWLDVDGQRAYAYTGGKAPSPAQPTVVFIHGAQHDHSVWILQSRYLAHHGFSVLALDLPGHGRSTGEPLATVPAMAKWVSAVLDAAGVASVAIVGHSMGSLIGLELAGSAPARVARLVMVGGTFPMKVSDALLSAARDDEARAFDMINTWSHLGLNHHPGCPGPGFSVFVQNLRLMERQHKGVLLNDFSACNAYAGGFERADALECPVLFLLGANDQMTPPKSTRALIQRVAKAEVVQVERCGHALMSERPDAVLNALRGFLGPLRDAAKSTVATSA